ncbi:MAG: hypothetical protein ACRYGR_10755, partial [Janthinobacterium lividum]
MWIVRFSKLFCSIFSYERRASAPATGRVAENIEAFESKPTTSKTPNMPSSSTPSPLPSPATASTVTKRGYSDLPLELRQLIISESIEYTGCSEGRDFIYIKFETALRIALVSAQWFEDIFYTLDKASTKVGAKLNHYQQTLWVDNGPTGKSVCKDYEAATRVMDRREDAKCLSSTAGACYFHQRFQNFFEYHGVLRFIVRTFKEQQAHIGHERSSYKEARCLLRRMLDALNDIDDTQDI